MVEINKHFTFALSWTYFYFFLRVMSSSVVDRQAKDVIKAIKKRLGSKNPNTQLYAVQVGSGPDLSYTIESCFMRMSYFSTFW